MNVLKAISGLQIDDENSVKHKSDNFFMRLHDTEHQRSSKEELSEPNPIFFHEIMGIRSPIIKDAIFHPKCFAPISPNGSVLYYNNIAYTNSFGIFYRQWREALSMHNKNSILAQVIRPAGEENCFFLDGRANFGHFIYETLPKAWLMSKMLSSNSLIYTFAGWMDANKALLLDAIGIPLGKLVTVEETYIQMPNICILPVLYGRDHDGRLFISPSALKDIRKQIVAHATRKSCILPTERVYLKRGAASNKILINESELESRLVDLGFTIIDGMRTPIWEQIAAVSQAKLLVGAIGASTSLSAFANDSSNVVELHPSAHIYGMYNCGISRHAYGYNYIKYVCDLDPNSKSIPIIEQNYTVDVERLCDEIKLIYN